MSTGIVNIRGRDYKTVALRVAEFRAEYPISDGWGIVTEPATFDGDYVRVRCVIVDPEGIVVGSGQAEEDRTKGKINATSALENCETSAIGRALASAGYGGDEYASANELLGALQQQAEPAPVRKLHEVTEALLEEADAPTMADLNGGPKRPTPFRQLVELAMATGKTEEKAETDIMNYFATRHGYYTPGEILQEDANVLIEKMMARS